MSSTSTAPPANFSQAEFDGCRLDALVEVQHVPPRAVRASAGHDLQRLHRRVSRGGGHKVKPFPIPRHWLRYVGVDPGVINTCFTWYAQDPETYVYYQYRESVGERKGAAEHAADAMKIAADNGEYVAKWAVGAKSEIYHREDWEKAGAGTVVEPAHNDVEAGIDRVISLFRQRRLFIFDDCAGTLDQLSTYSREIDDAGDVTEKIKDKAKYHYLDAKRYAVEHFDFYEEAPGGVNYADDDAGGAYRSPY